MPWADPAEQTGSDLETLPIGHPEAAPAIPVGKRWHRWRLYKDGGQWHARQPSHLEVALFAAASDTGIAYRAYGHSGPDHELATAALRAAIALARELERTQS